MPEQRLQAQVPRSSGHRAATKALLLRVPEEKVNPALYILAGVILHRQKQKNRQVWKKSALEECSAILHLVGGAWLRNNMSLVRVTVLINPCTSVENAKSLCRCGMH